VAGNPDLSYSIRYEQVKEKRLAQAPENSQKAQGTEKGPGQDGKVNKFQILISKL
jgi:hypothetical protein